MNPRRTLFFLALALSPLAHSQESTIQFAGVMTAGGKTRIALTDAATKSTTWVEPGAEFNGYTVARYDPKEEAVFLKKGGRETRLGLVAAKTPDTPASAKDNASQQAQATAIRANLRQLASAARQYQLERGASSANYADLVGPDKLIKEVKPVAGENYSTLSFGPNVTAVSVTTANGTTISHEVAALPPGTAGVAATPPPTPVPPASVAIARDQTKASSSAQADSTSSAPPSAETLQPTGRQPVSPSYMIQGGDTWEKISAVTGVPVPQLRQLNPSILEGSPLPAGQTIRVR
jgi:type IV pilus assembly protein PilA